MVAEVDCEGRSRMARRAWAAGIRDAERARRLADHASALGRTFDLCR